MKRFLTIIISSVLFIVLNAQAPNKVDAQGKKQGEWEKRDEYDKLIYKGTFKNGKPIGKFTRYYKTGMVKSELTFTAGISEVPAKLYYGNGVVMGEGKYKSKLKEGPWKYYSYYDSTLKVEETYLKGKRNGEARSYYSNGKIAEKVTWKNDMKDGKWVQYFESGIIKTYGIYVDDKLHGKYQVNDHRGQLKVEGSYEEGLREGIWKYYENKVLKATIKYKGGNAMNAKELEEQEQEFFKKMDATLGKIKEPSHYQVESF